METQDFRNLITVNGPFIIIANQPFWGIDGLLLLKLICEIRPTFIIDSPRSKLRGIIDRVKGFDIYLLANPAAKLRGTGFTSSAKLIDSAERRSSAKPMRSPGFNTVFQYLFC